MIARVFMLLSLIALLAPGTLAAQDRYEVSGVVADSAGLPLDRAMVVALLLPDSTLTSFATTNSEGEFTIRRLNPGDYVLQVTVTSFVTHRVPMSIVDGNVDMGNVSMAPLSYGMEPLVVSVDHVPFLNRRDTLDFNAAAFETRPNATVEDLLRRLPGVEIDADGGIEVQGERVQKVLVEGKEFFGSDPTVATRGLPADAVERIQVYDKESDMAEFTGIPDGREQKTINLELTDAAKRGYFGQLDGGLGASQSTPGVGDDGDGVRYQESLGLNRFTPTTQLAAVVTLNNVNRAGFSVGNLQGFVGGAQGLAGAAGAAGGRGGAGAGGGASGFTNSRTIGLNGSHDFSENDWLRGSYFISDVTNDRATLRQQQQLLGSSVSSSIFDDTDLTADNLAHRIDLNGQRQFSAGHDLRLRATFDASTSSLLDIGSRQTLDPQGNMINSANTAYGADGNDLGGSANLTWRKRLDDSGRSVIADLRASLSRPEVDGTLNSTTEVVGRGGSTLTEILQQQSQTGRVFTNSQRLSLTQPLGAGNMLEIFGQRSDLSETQDRSIFDLTSGSPILNAQLSSGLDRTYGYTTGGFRLNKNTESTRVVVGLEAQRSNLEGTITGRDATIKNGYTHILPSADLRYQLNASQNVTFRYATSTREPSMNELQPFTDNSNPLSVYIGNPDLKPEYTHSLNADYRFFDQFTFVNFFTFARVSFTTDDIVTSRTISENAFQSLSPINADQSWNANVGFNFGRPIRSLGTNVSVNYAVDYARRPEFINGDENLSRILGNTVTFEAENRNKDYFDLEATARFGFENVKYSLNPNLDQSYLTSVYTTRGTVYLGQAWTLAGDWRYQRYDQDVFGTATNVSLLNASISRFVLNERGSVELSVVDILNQNQGVTFSSSASSISESRSQALGRYMLVKFNYRLGSLGGGRMGAAGRR